ncbi:MAG: hypothetical protein HY275_09025 [Gemmatimonadetes bacterium]|nr:hypothetical protein [Gemmatimonadota bacterium]
MPRRPHPIAWAFVVAGVAAQCFLIQQLWAYRQRPADCGESCAYAGMGLMVMLVGGLVVVLPGLVATIWLFVDARRQRALEGGHAERLALLGGSFAVTGVLVLLFVLPEHRPARAAVAPVVAEPALTPAQQRGGDVVAGYAWASDAGIRDVAACTTGSESFREGCRKFVRARGDTTTRPADR